MSQASYQLLHPANVRPVLRGCRSRARRRQGASAVACAGPLDAGPTGIVQAPRWWRRFGVIDGRARVRPEHGGSNTKTHSAIQSVALQFCTRLHGRARHRKIPGVQVPHIPTKEQVGVRIAQLVRAFASGNQSQFARLCGLDAPNVSRYASGLHIPGGEHLARMALACNVSVDWILGLTEVHDLSASKPDEKIRIPERAYAVVDREAVRRFLDGEEAGERRTMVLAIDEHIALVDQADHDRLQASIDEAARKSRTARRRDAQRRARPE